MTQTVLLQELQRFAEEKAALQTQGLLGGDILELNVGGVHMSTTRNTLDTGVYISTLYILGAQLAASI